MVMFEGRHVGHSDSDGDQPNAWEFQHVLLNRHNELRKTAEVSPLQWSSSAEVAALRFAALLAENGFIEPDAIQRCRVPGRCCCFTFPSATTAEEAAHGCCDAITKSLGDVSRGLRHALESQYCHVIMDSTTHVGGALAKGAWGTIVVCIYLPPPQATTPTHRRRQKERRNSQDRAQSAFAERSAMSSTGCSTSRGMRTSRAQSVPSRASNRRASREHSTEPRKYPTGRRQVHWEDSEMADSSEMSSPEQHSGQQQRPVVPLPTELTKTISEREATISDETKPKWKARFAPELLTVEVNGECHDLAKVSHPMSYGSRPTSPIQSDTATSSDSYPRSHQAVNTQQRFPKVTSSDPPGTLVDSLGLQSHWRAATEPSSSDASSSADTTPGGSVDSASQIRWMSPDSSSSPTSSSSSSSFPPLSVLTFKEQLLSLHNSLRNAVQVPPLEWCNTLEGDANAYAKMLAAMEHPDVTPEMTYLVEGISVFHFPSVTCCNPIDIMTLVRKALNKESARYVPGSPIRMQRLDLCGRYTQVVWAQSTKLGAAMVLGCHGVFVVCRYSPPGNQPNEMPYPGITPSSSSSSAKPPVNLASFQTVMLALHNQARLQVSVPPLQWSPKLGRLAQLHAATLAEMGQLRPSTAKTRPEHGESLYHTFCTSLPPGEAAIECCREFEEEGTTRPERTSTNTGDSPTAARYQQMISATAKLFGAGMAVGPNGTFIVCRYSPAGDQLGETTTTAFASDQPSTRVPPDNQKRGPAGSGTITHSVSNPLHPTPFPRKDRNSLRPPAIVIPNGPSIPIREASPAVPTTTRRERREQSSIFNHITPRPLSGRSPAPERLGSSSGTGTNPEPRYIPLTPNPIPQSPSLQTWPSNSPNSSPPSFPSTPLSRSTVTPRSDGSRFRSFRNKTFSSISSSSSPEDAQTPSSSHSTSSSLWNLPWSPSRGTPKHAKAHSLSRQTSNDSEHRSPQSLLQRLKDIKSRNLHLHIGR